MLEVDHRTVGRDLETDVSKQEKTRTENVESETIVSTPFSKSGDDMIRHDPEALTLYSELVTEQPGRRWETDNHDSVIAYNISNKKVSAGTSKPYALRKVGLLL